MKRSLDRLYIFAQNKGKKNGGRTRDRTGDTRIFSIGIYWNQARCNRFRTGKKSQTGTRLPLSGVEFGQPCPGHHRSHPQRQRTRRTHVIQTPQRLPRKLDQAAETIWDGINMANIFFVCQLKLYFSG